MSFVAILNGHHNIWMVAVWNVSILLMFAQDGSAATMPPTISLLTHLFPLIIGLNQLYAPLLFSFSH